MRLSLIPGVLLQSLLSDADSVLLYLAANERRREKQVQIPSGQSVGAKDFIMEHGNGRTKDFSIYHILSHSSRPAHSTYYKVIINFILLLNFHFHQYDNANDFRQKSFVMK